MNSQFNRASPARKEPDQQCLNDELHGSYQYHTAENVSLDKQIQSAFPPLTVPENPQPPQNLPQYQHQQQSRASQSNDSTFPIYTNVNTIPVTNPAPANIPLTNTNTTSYTTSTVRSSTYTTTRAPYDIGASRNSDMQHNQSSGPMMTKLKKVHSHPYQPQLSQQHPQQQHQRHQQHVRQQRFSQQTDLPFSAPHKPSGSHQYPIVNTGGVDQTTDQSPSMIPGSVSQMQTTNYPTQMPSNEQWEVPGDDQYFDSRMASDKNRSNQQMHYQSQNEGFEVTSFSNSNTMNSSTISTNQYPHAAFQETGGNPYNLYSTKQSRIDNSFNPHQSTSSQFATRGPWMNDTDAPAFRSERQTTTTTTTYTSGQSISDSEQIVPFRSTPGRNHGAHPGGAHAGSSAATSYPHQYHQQSIKTEEPNSGFFSPQFQSSSHHSGNPNFRQRRSDDAWNIKSEGDDMALSKYHVKEEESGDTLVDITEYLNLPQSEAAIRLGIPPSTLSKRWKEAAKHRKWPHRMVAKIDKEIATLLHNIPQGGAIPEEMESTLAALLAQRQEELKPIAIRL